MGVSQKTIDRADFIFKTYAHLFGAIVLFVLLEIWYFSTGQAEGIAEALLSVSWLIVLGAFIVVAWIASHMAHNIESVAVQYIALALYVFAESVIFVPLLVVAEGISEGTIASAAQLTVAGFLLLTMVVFYTRKNFSFLWPLLLWGGLFSCLLIVWSVLTGSSLGNWFSIAMIIYAGGAILYDTSNVLHDFDNENYVAASLELFASVALLFWYIVRLLPFIGDD